MRLQSPPEITAAFVQFPVDFLDRPFWIDLRQTEALYRVALEKAQAMLKPTIVDRLAPYWN